MNPILKLGIISLLQKQKKLIFYDQINQQYIEKAIEHDDIGIIVKQLSYK